MTIEPMETVDFNQLDYRDGQRWLDLGCGEGRHTLASALRAGNAVGLDADRAALRRAKDQCTPFANASRGAGAMDFVLASATRLPFPDASFDHVLLCEVLEHFECSRATLDEVARVLRPGGNLVVSVPRFGPEWICWKLAPDYAHTPGGHVRILRTGPLIDELARHGFRLTRRWWAHALHAPFWWLQCLLWEQRETSALVAAYHRLLVWDLMARPRLTRWLEAVLNPFMGKSLVLYLVRD